MKTPKFNNFFKRKPKQLEAPSSRITSDTLVEHREQVLAGGRKFKYPMQYARHRLVINTIIISVSALLLLVVLGWYALYKAQNTSEFMYHVTRVIPVPVAVVDGQPVRYSSYLMKYRSSVHYLVEKEQVDINSESGKQQLAYVKERAMSSAIAEAYAAKLAKQLNISVSDADYEAYLTQQRQSDDGEVSVAAYNAIIQDHYNWSPGEYKDAMKSQLLRQKVAYAVDSSADELVKKVESKISAGQTSLETIASELNAEKAEAVTYWPEAWLPRSNDDGGRTAAAAKLLVGQISPVFKAKNGDGYYIVKLLNQNEQQVQYAFINIPLSEFNSKLETALGSDSTEKYIAVETSTTQE